MTALYGIPCSTRAATETLAHTARIVRSELYAVLCASTSARECERIEATLNGLIDEFVAIRLIAASRTQQLGQE